MNAPGDPAAARPAERPGPDHAGGAALPPRPIPLEGGRCPFAAVFAGRRSWLDLIREKAYRTKLGRFRIWPFPPIFMVNDPGDFHRVMDDPAMFPKGPMRLWDLMIPVVGHSIANTNGQAWRRIRSMVDPAFTALRMRQLFPIMRTATDEMVRRVDRAADEGVLVVDAETTHVTGDIILRVLLSQPMSAEDSRRTFAAFLSFTSATSASGLLSVAGVPRWFQRLWIGRRSRRDAKTIRDLLRGQIQPRFEAWTRGEPGPWQDILAGLMEARDEQGAGFSLEELIDQVAMLFLAGHETSASALAWAVWLLATHPGIQERVAAEIAREVGTRPFEHTDIKRLTFCLDVYRETLRLYPPVGFIPRAAAGDTELRDRPVGAGCPVIVAPWVIHRHRKLWRDPDVFDPDRFRRGDEGEAIAEAYLPFGLGPRSCLGAGIALQEGVLVLAALVRSYRFTPLPGETPEPFGRVTVRTRDAMRVGVSRR